MSGDAGSSRGSLRGLFVLAAVGMATCALGAEPVYVMHDMQVRLDQVAAGEQTSVGTVDHMRLVYDQGAIDPKTKHVRLINLQHFTGGKYQPEHPDAVLMPMDDAWLDLSAKPYRLHYRAAVVHGKPIIIDIGETTRRLTLHPQADPKAVLISGAYKIDSTPIKGPLAMEAATAPKP